MPTQNVPTEVRAKQKICRKCGIVKAVEEYYRNTSRPDGISVYCIPCHISHINNERANERRQALELLGGCCIRCGFNDPRALQIDHVQGGGGADRKKNGWHTIIPAILAGARPGEFQLLCANCNLIKRIENREHRRPDQYTRAVATERTFKGWKDRRPPTEEQKRKTSESLKQAYAEGRHASLRGLKHTEEHNRKISEGLKRHAAAKLAPEPTD